jgi:glycosyltransferase involved in cell wall biosynthesis
MGYLNPRKGTDVLIESLARLKAQYAGCVRLLIAGEPFPGNEGWVGQLRRRIQALGLADDVIFAGFVDDVAQFFAAINVFAFPAREPEGFGMAVAEAMAAGVPVVATRLGGVIEIVEDGKTGRLIPAGSVEELTAALLALLRDSADRARMSAAGRAKVAEQFNLERAVGELQSLYLAL